MTTLTTKTAIEFAKAQGLKVSKVVDGKFTVSGNGKEMTCERVAKGLRDWNVGKTRISSQVWAILTCVEIMTGKSFF